jgi:hypothetical protein
MKEDRESVCANDEDELERAKAETFTHFDQHDQSRIDISKTKTMKRD